MSKKNIVILFVIIIAVILLFAVRNGRGETENEGNTTRDSEINVIYNTVTNEVTGEKEYVVYNSEGEEITTVQEEYQLKIYEVDPDYEELPVTEDEEETTTETEAE